MTTGVVTARGNAILDANRAGGANLAAPTNTYTMLHTGDPGAAGTNNISVGDPTRKLTTHSAPSGVSMALSNSPTWTNGGTSETITHTSEWDSPAAGTCLYTAAAGSNPWVSGQVATLTGLTVSITPVAA